MQTVKNKSKALVGPARMLWHIIRKGLAVQTLPWCLFFFKIYRLSKINYGRDNWWRTALVNLNLGPTYHAFYFYDIVEVIYCWSIQWPAVACGPQTVLLSSKQVRHLFINTLSAWLTWEWPKPRISVRVCEAVGASSDYPNSGRISPTKWLILPRNYSLTIGIYHVLRSYVYYLGLSTFSHIIGAHSLVRKA